MTEKAQSLTQDPFPADHAKLKGSTEFFRVKVGEFRIIYQVDAIGNLVIVALIGKRNDAEIYRQFARLN